jgi:hypothetical protein
LKPGGIAFIIALNVAKSSNPGGVPLIIAKVIMNGIEPRRGSIISNFLSVALSAI